MSLPLGKREHSHAALSMQKRVEKSYLAAPYYPLEPWFGNLDVLI
jgi:hypothetical protein